MRTAADEGRRVVVDAADVDAAGQTDDATRYAAGKIRHRDVVGRCDFDRLQTARAGLIRVDVRVVADERIGFGFDDRYRDTAGNADDAAAARGREREDVFRRLRLHRDAVQRAGGEVAVAGEDAAHRGAGTFGVDCRAGTDEGFGVFVQYADVDTRTDTCVQTDRGAACDHGELGVVLRGNQHVAACVDSSVVADVCGGVRVEYGYRHGSSDRDAGRQSAGDGDRSDFLVRFRNHADVALGVHFRTRTDDRAGIGVDDIDVRAGADRSRERERCDADNTGVLEVIAGGDEHRLIGTGTCGGIDLRAVRNECGRVRVHHADTGADVHRYRSGQAAACGQRQQLVAVIRGHRNAVERSLVRLHGVLTEQAARQHIAVRDFALHRLRDRRVACVLDGERAVVDHGAAGQAVAAHRAVLANVRAGVFVDDADCGAGADARAAADAESAGDEAVMRYVGCIDDDIAVRVHDGRIGRAALVAEAAADERARVDVDRIDAGRAHHCNRSAAADGRGDRQDFFGRGRCDRHVARGCDRVAGRDVGNRVLRQYADVDAGADAGRSAGRQCAADAGEIGVAVRDYEDAAAIGRRDSGMLIDERRGVLVDHVDHRGTRDADGASSSAADRQRIDVFVRGRRHAEAAGIDRAALTDRRGGVVVAHQSRVRCAHADRAAARAVAGDEIDAGRIRCGKRNPADAGECRALAERRRGVGVDDVHVGRAGDAD